MTTKRSCRCGHSEASHIADMDQPIEWCMGSLDCKCNKYRPKARFKGMALFLVLSLFAVGSAEASIDERLAVKSLIGEAGGQSDQEIQAHAYALKNRGTLKGVYGLSAKHTPNPTPEQWQRVSAAWWTALLDESDPLGGRTEWRSDYDLKIMAERGETPESQGLYDGIKVGKTTFYKLRSK